VAALVNAVKQLNARIHDLEAMLPNPLPAQGD